MKVRGEKEGKEVLVLGGVMSKGMAYTTNGSHSTKIKKNSFILFQINVFKIYLYYCLLSATHSITRTYIPPQQDSIYLFPTNQESLIPSEENSCSTNVFKVCRKILHDYLVTINKLLKCV